MELDQQERTKGELYELLERLRYAYKHVPTAQRKAHLLADYELLESLTLGSPRSRETDVDVFREAVVVTPRNTVRTKINSMRIKDSARKHRKVIIEYECGPDIVKFSNYGKERRASKIHSTLAKLLRDLPDKKCEGVAKVFRFVADYDMVLTKNFATELGGANGVPGKGTRLVLDPKEPPYPGGPSGVWRLKYRPLVLHFTPKNPRHKPIEGLPEGVLPVFPTSVTFRYTVPAGLRRLIPGGKTTIAVKREANFPVSRAAPKPTASTVPRRASSETQLSSPSTHTHAQR